MDDGDQTTDAEMRSSSPVQDTDEQEDEEEDEESGEAQLGRGARGRAKVRFLIARHPFPC